MKVKPLTGFEQMLLPLLQLVSWGDRRIMLDSRIAHTRELARMRKEQREMTKLLNKEARMFEEILIKRLQYRGAAHIQRHADISTGGKPVQAKKKPVQRVKFVEIGTEAGGEVIYYRIAVGRWTYFGYQNQIPFGVDVEWLVSPEMLAELTFACQRRVTVRKDKPQNGVWYRVHRLSGVDGIPTLVNISDLLDKYPTDYSKAPILVGIGEHREPHFVNLVDIHHVLIAGRSGGGKSNFLRAIICGMMRFTHPEQYRFIMIDLKKLELGPYMESPHLHSIDIDGTQVGPIIFNIDEAVQMLQWAVREILRRTDILLAKRLNNLDKWNSLYPDRSMPHLVITIDEFAQLTYMSEDKRQADLAQKLVIQVAQLGRALGVHLILATQYPLKEVIPNSIKVNVGLTMAARTEDSVQSVVILGSNEAALLPHDVPGRMIAKLNEKIPVQTPYISDEFMWESIAISKGVAAGFIVVEEGQPVLRRDQIVHYIADCVDGWLIVSRMQALREHGIPLQELRLFLAKLIKAKEINTETRRFSIAKQGERYRLIEWVNEEIKEYDPNPYKFAQPLPALRELPQVPLLEAGEMPAQTEQMIIEITAVPVEESTEVDLGVIHFIENCCTCNKHLRSTASELYTAYKAWCFKQDFEILSKRSFGMALKARGFRPKATNGARLWAGLALKSNDPVAEVA